jgi:DNA polymerase-3 subunit alpha
MDGLGYPNDSFSYCISNGLDAHAITEHGNCNSYAHAELWVQEYNKKHDNKFKFLPGCEAYFHPDFEQWKRDKEFAEEVVLDKKAAKKKKRTKDEELQTKLIVKSDENDEPVDIEMSNALVVENEDESKSTKFFNPVNRRHHLVILPKNSEGLKKLFAAVSKSYLEGFYRFPRMDSNIIREAAKDGDLIFSSACLGGFPSWSIFQILQQYKFDELNQTLLDDPIMLEKCVNAVGNTYDLMTNLVGKENYYLELQFNKLPAQNLVNRAMIEFAKRNGVQSQLIVTCDAHYARPELWKERELYKKLGFMNYKSDTVDSLPKSKDELKCELYPKNAQQLWEEYQKVKQGTSFYDDDIICDAIERSYDVAHNVIGEVKPDKSIKLPRKIIPKEMTASQYLTKLCIEGLKKRGLHKKKEYIDRVKEELLVIEQLNVCEYFILLQKVMELAKKTTLCGPGRGSGGGSLVCYVLNITELDPLRWNLPFSRFMSVYRTGMPDIDSDVSNRDKVLDELRNEFGYNNVVPISNYNTFKLKSLVKDVSKFYGIPFEEVNEATKTVEQDVIKAIFKPGDDKSTFVLKYDEAMMHSPSFKSFIDEHPQVGESINVLFKQNKSLGRHAGGVLIADDLPEQMPLITSKGEPQSPFVEGVNFKHLEKLGNFIKLDLLGLETLRLIERTIELILRNSGKEIQFSDVRDWFEKNMSIDNIDLNDQKVYENVYHDGKFVGVFQTSGDGAQKFFLKAKPRSIVDIAALTSIYRPGPLYSNVDDLWIKHENEPYDWGHPLINETLKETRGLLVFQEQVMLLANKVGGYPMEQCDEIRRAIMKRSISGNEEARKKAKEMEDGFVQGAMINGISELIARKAYETILLMAGYGFNKSHATAYSINSFYCAWLLTYYPDEWLCSYLESMSTNPEDKARASSELRALGYKIVPIDINSAGIDWTILPNKSFMPSLLSCSGIGESAANEILQHRPYTSLDALLWAQDGSWRHSKFNKRGMEALIKIGAFESMDIVGEGKLFNNYRQMHHVLIENMDLVKKISKRDPNLGRNNMLKLIEESKDMPDWTKSEKVENHKEVLADFDITLVMSDDVIDRLAKMNVKPIDLFDKKDIYWCVITAVELKKTKNGKGYLVIQAMGQDGKNRKIFIWGCDDISRIKISAAYVVELDKNDFGFSTFIGRMKEVG